MKRPCRTFTHQGFGSLSGFVMVECTEHPEWARAAKDQPIKDAREAVKNWGREHEAEHA